MPTLFSNSEEPSRADKMRATRKLTNKLTADAIDWLNATGQFLVHRQNNIPSTRISRKMVTIPDCYDKDGKPKVVQYEEVKTNFKKNQVEFAILDIAGVTLPYGDRKGGLHVEIEVKYGSDTLSKEQKDRIKSLQAAGAISFAISNLSTLEIQAKPFMAERILAF